MKITLKQLKQLIKEAVESTLKEERNLNAGYMNWIHHSKDKTLQSSRG
jgi:hypothetical protein